MKVVQMLLRSLHFAPKPSAIVISYLPTIQTLSHGIWRDFTISSVEILIMFLVECEDML